MNDSLMRMGGYYSLPGVTFFSVNGAALLRFTFPQIPWTFAFLFSKIEKGILKAHSRMGRKNLNPADAHRKSQRKKEKAKMAKDRKRGREVHKVSTACLYPEFSYHRPHYVF